MQTDIWKHLFNIHPGEVCNFSVFCLSSGKYCKFYLVWLPLAYKLKTKKQKTQQQTKHRFSNVVEFKLSVESVHDKLWVDLEHGSRRWQLLEKGTEWSGVMSWEVWDKFTLWRFLASPGRSVQTMAPSLGSAAGIQAGWALWGAGLGILAGLAELGPGVAGHGGRRWQLSSPLCRAAPLTNGIGSAGCETEAWCSDCPVSPCGMEPVCLSHSKVTRSVRLQCKASLRTGTTANSHRQDLETGLRLLIRVEKPLICAHAAVSSFGQLSQMLMWDITPETCLKTSIKPKPKISFLQYIAACWGLH